MDSMTRIESNSINHKNIYYITDCYFVDWAIPITKHTKILYATKITDVPHGPNIKIIPMDVRSCNNLYGDKRVAFEINKGAIDTLNDKCLFAIFMMEHFPDHIPTTVYLSRVLDSGEKIEYNNEYNKSIKLIEKPARGYASIDVVLIETLENTKPNIIVSEYIDHEEFYTGHIFVHDGHIIKQIYFKGHTNGVLNYIQRGIIRDYVAVTEFELGADTDIFSKIFTKLNYTGLVSTNFIIVNQKIIIFEINPRPGGSLIYNDQYCSEFFQTIMDTFDHDLINRNKN